MAKKFFVDSENVGELWIDMYLEDADDNEYLVFYTIHSPRVDFEHMTMLVKTPKRPPKFIKCYEGTNALDFQLVSYLGFQNFSEDKVEEIIIVSNDTGYDSVIHFWQDRNVNISRFSPKDSLKIENEESVVPGFDELEQSDGCDGTKICGVEAEELYTIINCIGAENKNHIHSSLVCLFGLEKGGKIYKLLKENSFAAPNKKMKAQVKVSKFCDIICKYCNPGNVDVPSELAKFYYENLTSKGMKTITDKIISKYGYVQGPRINKIFKPFYPVIVEVRKKNKYSPNDAMR